MVARRHGSKTSMGRAPGRFVALLALALSPCACASSTAPSVAIRNPPAPPPVPAQSPAQAPPPAADPGGPMGLDESDQDEGSPDADDTPPAQGRGWLGVELEPAAPDEGGVRIGRVVPKSP